MVREIIHLFLCYDWRRRSKIESQGNAEFTGQVLASLISASDIEGGSIDIGNGVSQ